VTVIVREAQEAGPSTRESLVEVRGLTVAYGEVVAVDGIDLTIGAGEIIGLAGESGCGKTTVANSLMQILRPPAHITGGNILFRGDDLTLLGPEELRRHRWRNVSMVFQSAMNALNPVMRVGAQFVDMMQAHERISKGAALARAAELLDLVGIDKRRIRAYPHELSGGMRQRVIIAMALALRPELVIMDEPTTALDVVVQREILQQVRDLQRELDFAVLFITHDLSLLFEIADRIAIMYAGEIVEHAPADRLRTSARHPYTLGLVGSFPSLTGPLERMTGIPGAPPDLAAPPSGCRFHPRCPHCTNEPSALHTLQTTVAPRLHSVAVAHEVACHLVEQSA
jgi:peptide/nickel transport system ATP-binding protein